MVELLAHCLNKPWYIVELSRICQILNTAAPRVRGKSLCGCVICFQVNHAFITLHNLNLESVLGIQYTFPYLLEPLRISQTLDTAAPRVRGKSQCGCVIFFQSIMPL